MDLITGSIDLTSVDQELARLPGHEERLRTALAPLRQDYDFIILDCPPSFSLVSVNALVAADNYVLPAVPHYLSLTGIDGLIATVDRLTDKCGVRPELLGIVLTQVDYRTRACRKNVEEIRERYGSAVFAMEIRTNIRLAEAPERGQTVFQYDPTSTGARAYKLLAGELLMRGRAQRVHREESKRRQEYERERRERREEPLPMAEVLALSDLRRSSGR